MRSTSVNSSDSFRAMLTVELAKIFAKFDLLIHLQKRVNIPQHTSSKIVQKLHML